jgi:low affinity Fe/Cu permease
MQKLSMAFSQAASVVSRLTGRPFTFLLCCTIVVVWGVTGPMFGYSDTWQLVINTGTTIITFLMVFLIQNTQNRDNAALQAKLDELIRVTNAKNSFIGIEHLSDDELEDILAECERNRPQVIDRAEARVASERKKKPTRAGRRAPQRRARSARARKSA